MKRWGKRGFVLALGLMLASTGCAGAGGGGGASDTNSISVLMVNNPQLEDLQKLSAVNFS